MEWFNGSIPEAVAEAKKNNKLFLVFIEGNDEMSNDMANTYNDANIAQKLSTGNVIALKLAANSEPCAHFCAIYPVLIIPSSYFIGVNGVPIEIITGSLVATEFAAKIDRILEIHEHDSESKRSSQAASSSSDPQSFVPQDQSNQPSTSQAPEDTTNVPPLDERVDRAKALLEAKKQMKEQEQQEKEKQQELERRTVGKALQKAQQQNQDNELKEWAKNRAKEKEEERLAREKVKSMIAQDRAERAARYQLSKEAEEAERERLARAREEQEQAARNAALNSNEARIQFRLPDGSSSNHTFPADTSLDDVRKFVINEVRPPFSRFSLCTTFPRRHFTQSNYSESLRDLQLAPSAVLLILPDQTVSSIYNTGNFLSNMFWFLLTPFTSIWRVIASFLPGGPQNPDQQNEPTPDASQSTSQADTSANQSGARRRNTNFVKQEGNIYRINNQSDDDENNTWNGNSTQQM